MTTNQTIDGVPRELLERIAESGGYVPRRAELRALLDADECCHEFVPFQASCTKCGIPYKPAAQPQGEEFSAVGWGIDHTAGRPILVHNNCSVIEAEQAYGVLELIRKSAQPQGDPVAWQRKSKMEDARWFALPDSDVEEALRLGYEVRKLYAEQPAPVAVVMPDRMEPRDEWDMESHQWNACLDELRRLNP